MENLKFKLAKALRIIKPACAIVLRVQICTFNRTNPYIFETGTELEKFLSRIVKLSMKSVFFFLLLYCHTVSWSGAQSTSKNTAFTFGEQLNFQVSYGWFNLAEAKMQVSENPLREGDRVYYKIDAFGHTTGAATIFGRINDNWGTHLDTGSLLPSMSYRHIEEGKYRKHEKVYFDQTKKKAKMELYDRENKQLKEVKEFTLPGQVQDLVSGFYLLRTMNLNNLRKGQEILITGFFDKEIYNLNLIFEGTEQLETSLGKKETYIFSPRIPKNKLFRGEYPVKVWVTKDQNKIPVKIKANLFVGSLNIDISSAEGLRNN